MKQRSFFKHLAVLDECNSQIKIRYELFEQYSTRNIFKVNTECLLYLNETKYYVYLGSEILIQETMKGRVEHLAHTNWKLAWNYNNY